MKKKKWWQKAFEVVKVAFGVVKKEADEDKIRGTVGAILKELPKPKS